jgi:aspartyl protease family protein
MLGWLTLIIAVLAGLLLLVSHNGDIIDALPTGLVVLGVITLLGGLYIASHRQRSLSERGLALLAGALALFGTGAAVWWYGSSYVAMLRGNTPAAEALRGSVSVLIRQDAQGAFVAQGQVNGVPVDFLIDTGAATVTIKYSDAEKAGIDVGRLSFTTPVNTANGTVYAAPARLRSVNVGLIRVEDVEALVAKPGSLNENLLGISFLRRLSSYALKGDFLTLRQ